MVFGEWFAVDAEAQFVAFGDESEFVPFGVGLVGDGEVFGFEEGFEIGGDFLFVGDGVVTAFAIFEVHDAGFLVGESDAGLGEDAVAEVAGMHAWSFAIDKAELEGFVWVEAGEFETDNGATVLEAGFVMDVGGVFGFFGSAGDFEDAFIEVGHFDVGDAVRGGAVPAIADGFGEVAILLAVEGVMEDEGASFLEPGGVFAWGGGGDEGGEAEDAVGENEVTVFHERRVICRVR